MQQITDIFKIEDLKKRIFFVLGALAVYRLGATIPIPGINTAALQAIFAAQKGSILGFLDIFSGGALSRFSIFSMGVILWEAIAGKPIAEAIVLVRALKDSMRKISIFLFALMTITILLGTVMYVIEGGRNGFTSIPQSIYWAIITITTVGYGDIVPTTSLGKFVSSIAMIVGYAIIAIPTGIVSVEMSKAAGKEEKNCSVCGVANDMAANFCSHCGKELG